VCSGTRQVGLGKHRTSEIGLVHHVRGGVLQLLLILIVFLLDGRVSVNLPIFFFFLFLLILTQSVRIVHV